METTLCKSSENVSIDRNVRVYWYFGSTRVPCSEGDLHLAVFFCVHCQILGNIREHCLHHPADLPRSASALISCSGLSWRVKFTFYTFPWTDRELGQMELKTLNVEEVLRIHDILVEDFLASNDPISPAGVRSEQLLESAVSRQWTGLGQILKYPTPVESAATLLYGICGDHPFHNGNKRTALVSMLAHLDKNKH